MNILNQAKVVVATPILGDHNETTVEEVELFPMTSWLQVTIVRGRRMLQSEVNHPC